MVSVVAAPTSVSARDDDGTASGSGTGRSAGPVDLFVLFVGFFLVIDVGPGAEERLDQVHAHRGPGSGPGAELAPGLFRDQPSDVREYHDHPVAGRPHAERRGQGPSRALHIL